MNTHKLLPIVLDPLLDAIYDGFEYDAEGTTMGHTVFDDAMVAFDIDQATNYIDLMPNLATELVLRRVERWGDGGPDPYSEKLLAWCGRTFSHLVAFEVSQQIA